MPGTLAANVRSIAPVAERLMDVTLECRPALEIINTYGRHPSVLLYVDPPYLGSTRAAGYRYEMRDDAQHRELAAALDACRAVVVLSGYHSPLYDEVYKHWHRSELDAHTGQSDAGSQSRTEVLWSNRPFPNATPALFDA